MAAGVSTLLGAACWTGGSTSAEDGPESAHRPVIVQNDNFADVHVYIVGRDGGRNDLGLASAFGESRFRVPLDRLTRNPIGVLIDPVGGGRSKLIPDIYFPEDADALKVVVGAQIDLSHVVIQ